MKILLLRNERSIYSNNEVHQPVLSQNKKTYCSLGLRTVKTVLQSKNMVWGEQEEKKENVRNGRKEELMLHIHSVDGTTFIAVG